MVSQPSLLIDEASQEAAMRLLSLITSRAKTAASTTTSYHLPDGLVSRLASSADLLMMTDALHNATLSRNFSASIDDMGQMGLVGVLPGEYPDHFDGVYLRMAWGRFTNVTSSQAIMQVCMVIYVIIGLCTPP